MATRARHGSFLFKREGSENWWVRLRSPGVKRVERSLGTPHRAVAEIKAAPMVAEHKARLLASRPLTRWGYKLEPGREHIGKGGHHEGKRIVATPTDLILINPDGTTETEPNSALWFDWPPKSPRAHHALVGEIGKELGWRPTVATKTADDALLETYLKHASITDYYEREARAVWELYLSLTKNKPLKDATRDDGRLLVEHFHGKGLKRATIQKKLGWLTAAVNLAIREGKLKFNPFASIVPKGDDGDDRLPFTDDDVKVIKRGLDRLKDSDQLLVRLLASTGMRLGEAYQIDGELEEHGIRYVVVGSKTDQSLRRVPFPAAVLPHLPESISEPLFRGGEKAASKRLNRFLAVVGVHIPRIKVAHSFRHRAQDRLRAAGCPEDMRWAVLGHEEETVAAGYGEGFPVKMLKRWIDRIGF